MLIPDVDSCWQNPCVVAIMDKFIQWTTESCGGKETEQTLSQGESASTLALTGFYCFSAHYIEDSPHLILTVLL